MTASDTAYLPEAGTLYVNGTGTINVLLEDMTDSDDPADGLQFQNVSGDFPRSVKKIFSTDTDGALTFILDK